MNTIQINRAPVLTLWAAVVAEQLGFKRDEALTLGKSVAGLTANRKGTRLGIYEPTPQAIRQARAEKRKAAGAIYLLFMGREIAALPTDDGLRALQRDKAIEPESVQKYLNSKFGEGLEPTREAMQSLARSLPPKTLASEAFNLYMQFRPDVATGKKGWGATGSLSLSLIRELANLP